MSEWKHTQSSAAEDLSEDVSIWPRPFRIRLCTKTQTSKPSWDHTLYRGPNGETVHVDYCTTKEQSEKAAKYFLQEEVVGFDMEWVIDWGTGPKRSLQDEVSMIQVASETRIALFHIGQHPGKTTEDLIAPSLRKVIESSSIIKTGHNIMSADCGRLHRYFGIKPRAIFELCHLHFLVSHGPTEPQKVLHQIRGVSLAGMVHSYLGYELSKEGNVRKGNWRRPLNDNLEKDRRKKRYAAADGYAGYMLYHCLNARRLAMDPTPPMPLLADEYLPFLGARSQPIRLRPEKEGEAYTTAELFFKVETNVKQEEAETAVKNEDVETVIKQADTTDGTTSVVVKDADDSRLDTTVAQVEGQNTRPCVDQEPLDAISSLLFNDLMQCRDALSVQHGCAPPRITSVAALKKMARQRPVKQAGLRKIRGVGGLTVEKYGAAFIKVISDFVANMTNTNTEGTTASRKTPSTGTKGPKKERPCVPREPLDETAKALFSQLREQRAVFAAAENITCFRVASNTVLEDLARCRPLNHASLLEIRGISDGKSESYGTQWLELIQAFCSKHNLTSNFPAQPAPHPARPNHPSTPSTEPPRRPRSRDSSLATATPVKRTPQLHTGLSFDMAHTSIDAGEASRHEASSNDDDDESDAFATPPPQRRASPPLKRKREDSPTARPPTWTPDARLLRNKLLALSKRLSRQLSLGSGEPVARERTLDQLALRAPQTWEELRGVEGVEGFVRACEEAGMDLLKQIERFGGGRA